MGEQRHLAESKIALTALGSSERGELIIIYMFFKKKGVTSSASATLLLPSLLDTLHKVDNATLDFRQTRPRSFPSQALKSLQHLIKRFRFTQTK